MLHRTCVYARYATPLYPFEPFAIHEGGELQQKPGRDRVEQWINPGVGHIPIPYEGGPRWRASHEDGVKAAIDELEAAAASIATLLDQLRQELLNNRHAVASSGSTLHPPVEPAQCGTTPAAVARASTG